MTLATYPSTASETSSPEDIAEAQYIAKSLVGIAKTIAVDTFRNRHGRDPIPMPARVVGRRQRAIAVQADADAREYNDVLTRNVLHVSRLWEASICYGSSTRIRLSNIRAELGLS